MAFPPADRTLESPRTHTAPDAAALPSPPRLLVLGTLGYVILPAAAHVGLWFAQPVGIIGAASLLWLAVAVAARADASTARAPTSRAQWAIPVAIGGAWGVLAQPGDWRKHNALLADLVREPWPVVYDLPGGDGVLSYGVGWYLPAASVGKATGWTAANVSMALWLAIGIGLVAWWAAHLTGHRWAGATLVLLFSGLDVIGSILLPQISGWWPFGGELLEKWPGEWELPSMLRGLFQAPHHIIPACLAAGLVLSGSLRRVPLALHVAVLAAVGIMSPFAALAVLPFMVLLRPRPACPASRPQLAAAVLVAATGVLSLLPRLSGPPPGVPDEVVMGLTFLEPKVPTMGTLDRVTSLVVLIVVEVLIIGYAILRFGPRTTGYGRPTAQLVSLAMVVVLASQVFRIGLNNDLGMRGPAVAFFVLALLLARTVLEHRTAAGRMALVAIVGLGALSPATEVKRALTSERWDGFSFTDLPASDGLIEIGERWYPERDSPLSQYLVDPEPGTSAVLRD